MKEDNWKHIGELVIPLVAKAVKIPKSKETP